MKWEPCPRLWVGILGKPACPCKAVGMAPGMSFLAQHGAASPSLCPEQCEDALVFDLALGRVVGPQQDLSSGASLVADRDAGLPARMTAIGRWSTLLGT